MGRKKTSNRVLDSAFFFSVVASLVLGLAVAWAYPREPNMTRPAVDFAFDSYSSDTPSNLTFHLSLTMPADVYLTNVSYQLDSELPIALSTGRNLETFHNFTATITAASDQQHILLLNIGIVSPYDRFGTADPHGHFVETVAWDANQIVNFIVNNTGTAAILNYTIQPNYAQPSYPPSPTVFTPAPEPSSTPLSTPSPTPSPSQTPSPTPSESPVLLVAVDSPQNKTYTSKEILISVSASDPSNHIGPGSVAYILDGNPQVVIAETPLLGLHSFSNSTVVSLPDGPHSVIGVGTTWFGGADGVFYSEPVYFTVEACQQPSPTVSPSFTAEPSTTPNNNQDGFSSIAIVMILAIAAVVAGLLVALVSKKRKKQM